jgi:hypothetical protein
MLIRLSVFVHVSSIDKNLRLRSEAPVLDFFFNPFQMVVEERKESQSKNNRYKIDCKRKVERCIYYLA